MSITGQSVRETTDDTIPVSPITDRMMALFQSVCTVGSRDKADMVVFLAAHAGCGASGIVREFARVATGHLGRRVLLLDANRAPVQPAALGVSVNAGWVQAAGDGAPLASVIATVPGAPPLDVAVLSTQPGGGGPFLDSDAFDAALAAVRSRYDLIVVDAPSPAESVDSLLLSRAADACVLVIESERTRWQVADNLRARVEKYGGRIVGVVLNKRRYHIPRAIYDRL